jgi:hypothetical protein
MSQSLQTENISDVPNYLTTDNKRDSRQMLDRLRNQIVDGLEAQGFDVRESEDVFEGLIKRYAKGIFPFRRKLHLGPVTDGTK